MRFCDLYPDMKPIIEEISGIVRSNCCCECAVCGLLTEYVEINYEAFFCSEECVSKMDKTVEKYNNLGCTTFKEFL